MKLDDLFKEVAPATRPVEQTHPQNNSLPYISAASDILDELLNSRFPALLAVTVALEKHKVTARRVDGLIIGTGKADFTQGNTCYSLNYKGKTFQLIDVPGIEGDEGKYAGMVREAVAKAHLVFYVNGTNKKPEKTTAEKIRSYLHRGAQVCPIVNVRGNADAYEFEEDRESLEAHGGASSALEQTMMVLESVLGKDTLLPGRCTQGLLAFCALAIDHETRQTTIHPSRDANLVLQQRNYMKHFASAKAMVEFSQVRAVAEVLHTKLSTFREDIIESNKTKVRELLAENAKELKAALKQHQAFIAQVEPEFEKCRVSLRGAVQSFERLVTAGRKNLWSDFFNHLSDRADDIVAEHFGDNDAITRALKKASHAQQNKLGPRIEAQFDECLGTLQDSIRQAMERLVEDIQRVEFQQRIKFDGASQRTIYSDVELDMDLGLKDWEGIAVSIGSYAVTGAGIGSSFPVIGTVIGAAIGAAVGALVSLMHYFSGKEKRIRQAQVHVQEKLNEARNTVMHDLAGETKQLVKQVQVEMEASALKQVDTLAANLARPFEIIKQQIELMTQIENKLKDMPYGTIQAIQC